MGVYVSVRDVFKLKIEAENSSQNSAENQAPKLDFELEKLDFEFE